MERLPNPDRIAKLCLNKYDQLPKTGKPLDNKEWTVCTCIVQFRHSDDSLCVVSLGTGRSFSSVIVLFDFIIYCLRKISRYEMHRE